MLNNLKISFVINSSLKQKEQPKNETVTNTTKMNTVSIKSDTSPITGEQITSDQKKTITIIDKIECLLFFY